MTCFNIEQIKALNTSAGHHFFDKDSMRFFKSRACSKVFTAENGSYFVTSERNDLFGILHPRLFSVRFINATGEISTVGEFQAYKTRASALTAAKRWAKISNLTAIPT